VMSWLAERVRTLPIVASIDLVCTEGGPFKTSLICCHCDGYPLSQMNLSGIAQRRRFQAPALGTSRSTLKFACYITSSFVGPACPVQPALVPWRSTDRGHSIAHCHSAGSTLRIPLTSRSATPRNQQCSSAAFAMAK
jgi:hypothetical protein